MLEGALPTLIAPTVSHEVPAGRLGLPTPLLRLGKGSNGYVSILLFPLLLLILVAAGGEFNLHHIHGLQKTLVRANYLDIVTNCLFVHRVDFGGKGGIASHKGRDQVAQRAEKF